MNKNILQIFITRSFFVVASACSGSKSASYGAIVGCLGAISGALEQEYHILSGHRFPRHLAFRCDCPPRCIIQYDLRIVTPRYYYHINVDSTFLDDGSTDHDETFRNYGGWPWRANIHEAMTS